MTAVIRPYSSAELSEVLRLFWESSDSWPGTDASMRLLLDANAVCLVADDQGRVVGLRSRRRGSRCRLGLSHRRGRRCGSRRVARRARRRLHGSRRTAGRCGLDRRRRVRRARVPGDRRCAVRPRAHAARHAAGVGGRRRAHDSGGALGRAEGDGRGKGDHRAACDPAARRARACRPSCRRAAEGDRPLRPAGNRKDDVREGHRLASGLAVRRDPAVRDRSRGCGAAGEAARRDVRPAARAAGSRRLRRRGRGHRLDSRTRNAASARTSRTSS